MEADFRPELFLKSKIWLRSSDWSEYYCKRPLSEFMRDGENERTRSAKKTKRGTNIFSSAVCHSGDKSAEGAFWRAGKHISFRLGAASLGFPILSSYTSRDVDTFFSFSIDSDLDWLLHSVTTFQLLYNKTGCRQCFSKVCDRIKYLFK